MYVVEWSGVFSHSWGSAHKLPDSASPQNTTDRSTARTSTFKYRAGSADGAGQLWQMDKPRPKRLSLSSAAVCSANEALKVGRQVLQMSYLLLFVHVPAVVKSSVCKFAKIAIRIVAFIFDLSTRLMATCAYFYIQSADFISYRNEMKAKYSL